MLTKHLCLITYWKQKENNLSTDIKGAISYLHSETLTSQNSEEQLHFLFCFAHHDKGFYFSSSKRLYKRNCTG